LPATKDSESLDDPARFRRRFFMSYAILTHGGAASPNALSDGCVVAAQAAQVILASGGDALAAALAATVVLEDDPRFNAGTGSNLRLDGRLIEMDASVMTSDGRFGGVACVQRVKNPIVLVAAKVRETPHLLLAGDGATAFARRLGFPVFDPTTEGARASTSAPWPSCAGAATGTSPTTRSPGATSRSTACGTSAAPCGARASLPATTTRASLGPSIAGPPWTPPRATPRDAAATRWAARAHADEGATPSAPSFVPHGLDGRHALHAARAASATRR
jgi:hypothetical protein